MFAEQFTQPGARYRVIISYQNTQRLRRVTRGVMHQPFLRIRSTAWSCVVGGGTRQPSARKSYGEFGTLSRSALDVQVTAKRSEALLNTEQSQTGLCLVLGTKSSGWIKSDAVIGHLDVNGVTGAKCEVDIDPVNTRVLDCIEEQLSDGLEEQDANITCLWVCLRVGVDVHDNAVLLLCSCCQP